MSEMLTIQRETSLPVVHERDDLMVEPEIPHEKAVPIIYEDVPQTIEVKITPTKTEDNPT